jgi:hypothetical protein
MSDEFVLNIEHIQLLSRWLLMQEAQTRNCCWQSTSPHTAIVCQCLNKSPNVFWAMLASACACVSMRSRSHFHAQVRPARVSMRLRQRTLWACSRSGALTQSPRKALPREHAAVSAVSDWRSACECECVFVCVCVYVCVRFACDYVNVCLFVVCFCCVVRRTVVIVCSVCVIHGAIYCLFVLIAKDVHFLV